MKRPESLRVAASATGDPQGAGPGGATAIVRAALVGTGIEVVASCGIAEYDASAPADLRSTALLPGARGVVVVGSAGPALWRLFLARTRVDAGVWDQEHPYDAFVAELLARADEALASAGVRHHRFDAAYAAPVRVSFIALARLTGLGVPGPFGLVIDRRHGPWWALRGAWLVDAETEPPLAGASPCATCTAPCIGGWAHAGGIALATPEARSRCVVGQASRFDDDQVAYHYDRENTRARLLRERQKRPSWPRGRWKVGGASATGASSTS